jgi:hypothetical protein
MPINGGSSAIDSINTSFELLALPFHTAEHMPSTDAAEDMAEDFNSSLHEHFKMARRANMKRTENNEDPPIETYRPSEYEHTVPLTHHDTMALLDIRHNRKTGEVVSSPYHATSSSPDGSYHDPFEARKALNEAKRTSRNFQASESGSRDQYRKELREYKKKPSTDSLHPIHEVHNKIRREGGTFVGSQHDPGGKRTNFYENENQNKVTEVTHTKGKGITKVLEYNGD